MKSKSAPTIVVERRHTTIGAALYGLDHKSEHSITSFENFRHLK
jgi:hypothetical protein